MGGVGRSSYGVRWAAQDPLFITHPGAAKKFDDPDVFFDGSMVK